MDISNGRRPSHLFYRPEIDGLRAIAVVSVVLYHYGFSAFGGGFVGVDVFFVISGFLITENLKRDQDAGSFSILGFYSGRIRRLLPALIVVIATGLSVGYFLLLPGDYAALAASAQYASFGVANYFFFYSTGYFHQSADLQPLLHLWSLGVEEQFYFFWPVFLLLAYRLNLSRARIAFLLTIVVAASFSGSIYVLATDPKAAFYFPHVRAWELALGGLLAFLPKPRESVVPAEILSVLGLLAIGAAVFALKPSASFPGFQAVVPCVGSACFLRYAHQTRISRHILSASPFVWLGRISYSLYLWHWPLLVFYRHYNHGTRPDLLVASALILASLLVSYVSWRWIEQPARNKKISIVVVPASATAMMSLFSLATFIAMQEGIPSRLPDSVFKLRSLDVMWQWNCPETVTLDGEKFCGLGAPWASSGRKAILWGDSHAEHLAPALDMIGKQQNVSIALYKRCPAILGGDVRLRIPDNQEYNNNRNCTRSQRVGISILQAHPEIQFLVLASSWPNLIYKLEIPGLGKDKIDAFAVATSEFIDKVKSRGRDLILLGDVPHFLTSPIPCVIGGDVLWRRKCSASEIAVARQAFERHQGPVNMKLRALQGPAVRVLLLGENLCGTDWCVSSLNNEFLYKDTDHIRRNLSPETVALFAKITGLDRIFHESRF